MTIKLDGLENHQELEVAVSGPEGADRLFIYTGIAVLNFKGESVHHWKRDTITFLVGRNFGAGQFRRATASAALASIYNDNVSNDAGWAVDSVDADWDDESKKVQVKADLAVRDTDGYIYRISYEVFVLARTRGEKS
ncbi:MAG TPA: hypothetical protein VMX35_08485 [Acidobacteriota bacterium]|nr:hypothetical protein [Acidobacteriota bacterium]